MNTSLQKVGRMWDGWIQDTSLQSGNGFNPASNSRQNNSSPKEKAEIAKSKTPESLKYEIMMYIARTSEWNLEACKKHGLRMKELLAGYKTTQF